MKLNVLTVAILSSLISTESTIAAPTYGGVQYKTYYSNINIGSCTLTNIKFVPTAQTATDPDGGNSTGTFAIDVNAGAACNLSVFLDTDNQLQNILKNNGEIETKRAGSWDLLNGTNPYTTQRNGPSIGSIQQDGNTLVFDTKRANGAGIEIAAGGKLVTDGNLKIIVNKPAGVGGTLATALVVNGEADIKGDLIVDKTRSPAEQDDWSRGVRVAGGILKVQDNLNISDMFWTGVGLDKNHSEALELVSGATVTVGKSASITHNLNSSGVSLGAKSLLDINENFLVKMIQLSGHTAAFGITSDDSTINVKGNLAVEGDEHVLINQSNNAVLNVNGTTKLTKTKSGNNYIQNNNSKINFNNSLIEFIGTGGNGLVNLNKGQVNFNDANTVVNGDSLTNVISNNNATINFLGAKSTVTGTVGNANNGVININGESIFDKTLDSNLIENDNAVINFNHDNVRFNGTRASGLVNTNNAHVYFNAADTVVEAGTLDNAIVNSNNATIHFLADSSTVNGNINNINRGIITLQNGKNGSLLTVNGNYVGADGILMMDVDLDDDNSDKDFVIINGKASGTTELQVNNINGLGSPTRYGIQIIQTNESEMGAFYIANKGYVSAGAYDYYLEYRQADTGGVNTGPFDNWYLMNYDYKDYIYTPDIGSYLAVETMGNTLFNSRLEDREGASQFQNLHDKDKGNVWVRAYGSHNQFKSMDSQLKTKGNSFVTQFGSGLVSLGEEDQYNLGVMGGLAYYNGKTHSNLTTRESKVQINGYSLGLYGTWYAHPVEERGAYIDSWVLWNHFRNNIDTPDQNTYKYNSTGVTASIEVGGDYLLNEKTKQNWWIQPQAQLIYQGVHADNFKDAQDIDINHGKDNIQARIGVKTYLNIPTNGNKLTSYRPYIALNYLHNTNPYSVTINNVDYVNEGSANQGEFKIGLEGHTTKNSQVWINAAYIAGSHDNQTFQGNVGWKYNF